VLGPSEPDVGRHDVTALEQDHIAGDETGRCDLVDGAVAANPRDRG